MVESERMSYIRRKQKDLRSETYSKLAKLVADPESGVTLRGKKVVLPYSYTGSPRYLSACEAVWRIYSFDIHYRFPPVERLPFHLPNEQSVIFDETESLDYTLEKALVNEIKIQAWME
nr:transmembrane protein, putative [Tanacetum cinerariifolium]